MQPKDCYTARMTTLIKLIIAAGLVLLVVGGGWLWGTGSAEPAPRPDTTVPTPETGFGSSRVDAATFATLEAAGYTIIDIRTPEEIAAGKVTPDALELDYYAADFPSQLATLDRTNSYALYCRSGNRSGDTLARMRALGFTDVVDLSGGIVAWQASGRPLVTASNIAKDATAPTTCAAEAEC